MGIAEAALTRLTQHRSGPWLTMFALGLYLVIGLDAVPRLFSADLSWLIVPVTIAVSFLQYQLSRQIGGALADEYGSIGRWLLWGIIPGLLAIIAIGLGSQIAGSVTGENLHLLWIRSIFISLAAAVSMPLLILSVGSAIQRDGPPAEFVFERCMKIYPMIIASTFSLLIIPEIMADYLLSFQILILVPMPAAVALASMGGIMILITLMLSTSIAACIYRSVETIYRANDVS